MGTTYRIRLEIACTDERTETLTQYWERSVSNAVGETIDVCGHTATVMKVTPEERHLVEITAELGILPATAYDVLTTSAFNAGWTRGVVKAKAYS
jgi:hypothetical protein